MSTENKALGRSLCSITIVVVIFLSLLCITSSIPVKAYEPTQVTVSPGTQTVSADDTFTVSIICIPGQPIKSFELRITFIPSLLQANSVSEGNIFEGLTTFFHSGTINNTAGTIINVYNLIIGPENVSTQGTLVTISFTAKTLSGTSEITLSNVGVTNEIGYVTLSVTSGYITVLGENQAPTVGSISPTNGSTSVSISTSVLSIVLSDLEGDLFNWSISTSPAIGTTTGVGSSNGSKTCSLTGLNYSTTYHWTVSCIDAGSGDWTNHTYWFTTEEEPPAEQPPSGGGDYTPPQNNGEQPPIDENNTAPQTPVQPLGQTIVKQGVSYSYTASSYDRDSDTIRFIFDWGDGSFSNWTEFVFANTSVTSSHSWSVHSNFSIRVLAQDEHGLNSSWSPALIVNDSTPIPQIAAPENTTANSSIVFDASGSYDPEGAIISYSWDFGDGALGTGVSPRHSYTTAGVYHVVLTVTDNLGNTYHRTFTVNVLGSSKIIGTSSTNFSMYYLVGLVFAVLIGCIIIQLWRRSRKQSTTKMLQHNAFRAKQRLPQLYMVQKRGTSSISQKTLEEKVDEAIISKVEQQIDEIK